MVEFGGGGRVVFLGIMGMAGIQVNKDSLFVFLHEFNFQSFLSVINVGKVRRDGHYSH